MARGLGGHRGSLMVSAAKVKAKYQAPPIEKVITVKCFKCKFFSTNDEFLNKHMTIEHLMGRGFKRMEKFVALATPNLLVSTLHKDDDEKILSEDSDDKADSLSEVSDIGVERLDEEDDNFCSQRIHQVHLRKRTKKDILLLSLMYWNNQPGLQYQGLPLIKRSSLCLIQ